MKIFQELELQGTKSTLTKAIEAIGENLDNGWTREYDNERLLSSATPDELYCFSCTKQEEREAADLWLASRNDKTLYVTNIVPQETDQLSVEQYNLIISEFYERFAKPTADALGLAHRLTPATKQIEDLLSQQTAAKLKRFVRLANKSTGSSHPLDRQRWSEFLVAAHTEATTIEPNILAQWLVENEGWSDDIAYNLSSEYNFSRSLLTFYDEYQT